MVLIIHGETNRPAQKKEPDFLVADRLQSEQPKQLHVPLGLSDGSNVERPARFNEPRPETDAPAITPHESGKSASVTRLPVFVNRKVKPTQDGS